MRRLFFVASILMVWMGGITGCKMAGSANGSDSLAVDSFKYAFADSMLIMHGTRDETVPIDAVRRFAEKNDLMLIEINGADHMFKDPARMSEYVNDTVDFIFS